MKTIYTVSLLLLATTACYRPDTSRIDLSGQWQFAADPANRGQAEQWYAGPLPETIRLPGSMTENGKGEVPGLKTNWTGSIYDSSFFYNPRYEKYRLEGDIKFPFWLTPNRYYKGAAWYRKEVNIPGSWNGRRIVLYLERPHWKTTVWVNETQAGSRNSLSTPHEYELTGLLHTGKNFITVCIDNRTDSPNVGPDSHSVSDHTQGNWNGMIGQLILKSTPKVYIDNMQLFPDIELKTVRVVIDLRNTSRNPVHSELYLQAYSLSGKKRLPLQIIKEAVRLSGTNRQIEVYYPMGDEAILWNEFQPKLYAMEASLKTRDLGTDVKIETFGMREIRVRNGQIEINGIPVFLRGTLENNVFPLTGYPPTDVASWEKVFRTCKESGFNHIRFHSHCPPQAAFTAADKLGLYLQPEAASWPNHGTSLGDGQPTDQYILDETKRIFKAYGNHPSFALWAYCNEPRGNYVPFLDASLVEWKAKDNRRIYTAASIAMSWQVNPESEYLVRSASRGLPFHSRPNSTFNYSGRINQEKRPYLTHETGQWCVFPNFVEIPKYHGVNKAKNFELFKAELENNHMGKQAHQFLIASGKLQALCYKAEIEASLRTPELDGFQLLGLTDFPGQGTALVGMLDVFWDEKGYISKNEISRFCNATVPLAELGKFVFTNDEEFSARLLVSHFGPAPLEGVNPEYLICTEKGDTILSGAIGKTSIPTGRLSRLGEIKIRLDQLDKATRCILELKLDRFSNSWEFWVFPAQLSDIKTDEVYYTTRLDQPALNRLNQGGKVFLDAAGSVENGKDIQAYFTPVFWNTSWFKMRPPHTLGVLVQENHPAFADFPTSCHSNYQWWGILKDCQVMCIDCFPPYFRPLVQPIDTWFLNRRLAQLFEARIGKGKLVVASLNLDAKTDPAAAQLRHSLLCYMNSPAFQPQYELDPAVIQELFEKKDRKQINFYTVATPDELKPDNKQNRTKQ